VVVISNFDSFKSTALGSCLGLNSPLVKVKVIPQKVEVSQGVPGRLRPRIFMTFGTTRAVGRQPYAPTAFTSGEISGTHFQKLSRPQGIWFRQETRKKSPVTPTGTDPGTSRLVAQCLNHYATPSQRPSTHCIRGWVDPRAGLDGCGKSRLHCYSIPVPSRP